MSFSIRTITCLAWIALPVPGYAQTSPTIAQEAAAKALGSAAVFGPANAPIPLENDKSMTFIADVNKALIACLKVEVTAEPQTDENMRQMNGPMKYPMIFSNRCDAPLHISVSVGGMEDGRCRGSDGSFHGTLQKGARQRAELEAFYEQKGSRCIPSVLELGTGEHREPTRYPKGLKFVPYLTVLQETRLMWLVDPASVRREGDIAFATIFQIDEFHGGGVKINTLDVSMNCAKPAMHVVNAQNYDSAFIPVRTDPPFGLFDESADAASFTYAYACTGKSDGLVSLTGNPTDVFYRIPRKPSK